MRVACFNPSGPSRLDQWSRVQRYLEGRGWTALPPPPLERGRLSYLAGPDADRLAQIHWALGRGPHEAAWPLRGGYGLARILSQVRWDELQPRWLMGFSDLTALLWPLYQRGWKDLHHGPNLESMVLYSGSETLEGLLEPRPRLRGRSIVPGQAEGPLVGGNLCVLASLCGTPYQFQACDCLVYLEEVREDPYRMDGSLTQLLHCGCLEGCRGIVLGQFTDCGSSHQVLAILRDRLGALGVPVLWGLPFGHGEPNLPFHYGGRAQLDGPYLLR